MQKIPTGSKVLDTFLDGGYDEDIITTVYGPGGSGKTNLCLICTLEQVRKGKKVIYVDTEGNFSLERFKQLAKDYEKVLENIIFFRPTTFKEQKNAFDKLRKAVNEKIGLVVVDTIAMLYRLEIGKSVEVYEINRELGLQISYLSDIARKHKIPVLITNQVYADFDNKDKVNMVGGDILKYGSKCLIELQNLHKNKRKVILRKHRSLPEGREIIFEIKEEGIFGLEMEV